MLLVVAATTREAAPLEAALDAGAPATLHGVLVSDGRVGGVPVRLAVTGFGRASTAFTLGRLLLDRPRVVHQVGVGGAFAETIAVGDIAVATEDVYADLGAETEQGWLPARELGVPLLGRGPAPVYDTFPCHTAASGAAASAADAPLGRFVTVETVTGTQTRAAELQRRHAPIIESMEGAAAAHACAIDGVPFVELRAASNIVGSRHRDAWRLDDAIAAAAAAAISAAAAVYEAAA